MLRKKTVLYLLCIFLFTAVLGACSPAADEPSAHDAFGITIAIVPKALETRFSLMRKPVVRTRRPSLALRLCGPAQKPPIPPNRLRL